MTMLVAMWQIAAPLSLQGATYYWDANGATAGAGGPAASGSWNTTTGTNWTTDSTGLTITAAWTGTAADTAVFSAGADATGTSVITIDEGGAITLGALKVEEGNVTINGNTLADVLNLSNAASLGGLIDVAGSSQLTINAILTGDAGVTKTGTGNLTLAGANTFTGNVLIRNQGGQSGGSLTLFGGTALVDTVNVRNAGFATLLNVNTSETIGALTGTANTFINLASGATLTANYTNGTPVAGSAAMDSDILAGRVVRLDGSITNPQVGMLISSAGNLPANSYIVQILDANHVLLNNLPSATTSNFAPTTTTVSLLHSAMSGAGGFTKDGTGLLIMTGNNTYTGTTTLNAGDIQVGGVWTGQKYSIYDVLSDNSRIDFSAVNATNLNFAFSATNLLSFERVGSLSGGAGATTNINLLAGSNIAGLVIGGDNSTSTFSGQFLGDNGATLLYKEGTGNFTWTTGAANVFDGPVFVENGTFTIAGATGFDASNEVYMSNRGASLVITTTGGDTIPFLQGGAGVARTTLGPNQQIVGGTLGNFLTSVNPIVTLTTGLTVNEATAANIYTFNGDIQGAGTLIKSGAHQFVLTGVSSNAHTGETQITAGTLRMGVLGAAAGVGTPAADGQTGTLSTATGLRLTGGVLDINSTSQTVTRINATSTGGTIQLLNGSLTLSNQNTQTTATVFTGNLASVININAAAASTLTLTGISSGFGGTINVGTNAALTLNLASGALRSTGIPAARVNLNGTGTQLTVTLSDTIGSLAGTGNVAIATSQSLTIREGASGTVSAAGFSGATSGAGALILSNYGGLTVSGNLAHTGGTTVSSHAALTLNYGAGNNILPAGVLTLNSGRIRVISSGTGILESVTSTTLGAGASSIQSYGTYSNTGAAALAGINLGAITRSVGGTLTVTTAAAATSTANTNSILGGWATFNGSTWAVANGATTAISGLADGSYSVDTFAANAHTNVTTSQVGGTSATLRFNTAANVDVSGTVVLSQGGIMVTKNVGANTSTISGALSSGLGNELIIHQHNMLGDLVLANVQGANTIITTAGAGRAIIQNNIAGTGGANIGYGYVQLGSGGATGSFGTGAILNNGTLGVNRDNTTPLTFGSIISGVGNFEQLGSGTTILGAANTFAGRVTVRAGTLSITNNAGLGTVATAPTNLWANMTTVASGATLDINVAGGGAITEFLNLEGGTVSLRSTVATTLAGPILLGSSSTINIGNTGAAVNHIISGEFLSYLPGTTNLTITGVATGTPSTLVLAPLAATGARWGTTTIGTDARLQIGNLNNRGWLGTGDVTNNGTLIISPNDGHYVITNTITGNGTLALTRSNSGNTYITGDLSGFSGTLLVSSTTGVNASSIAEIGNDTYANSFGTGAINIVSNAFLGTSGTSSLRSHLNQDVVLNNTISLTPVHDGTTAKNAQFIRAGLGNMTLSGTINLGLTDAGTATQRNLIQTEAGGKLILEATLANVSATRLLNIVNNNIVVISGSASHTYNGVLSSTATNSVWIFNNSGTTTLSGANTFDTVNTYIRAGTVALTGGAAIADNSDIHVLRGATLDVLQSETVGSLYSQRGATVNLNTGVTLTIDDNASHLFAGAFTGAGNLSIGANTNSQTTYLALYGTNTATGTLNIGGTGGTTARFGGIQATNLENAIGSFTTINLGVTSGSGGFIDYVGAGETFDNAINLIGGTTATTNRISANGSGALVLSGNLALTGGNSTLQLTGQTGGYFHPITNRITGAITEGANVLSIAMPNTVNDDRFGVTGRWALTNANNDFSGSVTVNVGILELNGDLKTGVETTSVLGDLSVARVITLGANNFDGRRYDMFGSTDQLGDQGTGSITNTLSPFGDIGTIIFNDPNAGTATFGVGITWNIVNASTGNTTGGQLINNGLKNIVINGALTAGATGTHIWFLDGSNATANTINGVISNPTTSQTTAVTKEGAGTWRLGGVNTYTGTTTVNNGILQVTGGAAISDAALVAVSAAGGDGEYSGVARFHVLASESIGRLTGVVGADVMVDSGQMLSIVGATSDTYSGTISGDGGFARTLATGATAAATQTLSSASSSYTGATTLGVSGTAAFNTGITVYHLANGGSNSSIGAATSAATNLVFTSNATNGGTLTWLGFTNQSTDRLFTMGTGSFAARINASGTLIGTTQPKLTFSNTGAIVMSGSGTRTLTLGGTGIVDNEFRPQITDGTGGATTLSKVDAGMWLINPDVAGNTYTGGTSITGGTLAIQAGNALGTGTVTINGAGGVGLEVRNGITLTNAITNSTADGGVRASSGANVFSGLITLTNQIRVSVDSGASLNFSNAVTSLTGSGILVKLGNGTLILSGTNNATGATNVRDGILRLEYGTNDTSKLADGAALTLGGIGALTVPGADDSVVGQTYIFGQGGGTVELSGGTHTEVVLSTLVDTGANAITRVALSTATLRMNTITRNAGGTVDFSAGGIATADNNNTNGILGGYATINKTDWAQTITTNPGDTAITALASYNVDTYGANNNVDVTTYAAIGTAANTLRFHNAAGGTFTHAGTFNMTAAGLLMTSNVTTGDVIITGGAIQRSTNTAALEALIIHQHSARALQINSVIQNNTNAQALTKVGTGKLFLNAINTYTGAVHLSEGEIQVGGTAAAPTVATNARLGGGNAINMAIGTTLRFVTTNTTAYNTGLITGDGHIILDSGVLLFDDDSANYHGNITLNGGTVQVNAQNNALGTVRGLLAINNTVNFNFNDARNISKVTSYSEGTTLNITNTAIAGTFSGKQNLNNTTVGGLNFNVAAPTTAGTIALNISGIIYGSNGFTKTGNGILQISGNNFSDVYDGFTTANKTATLSGQIMVNQGVLYVGGNRALGAFGVGNETIVALGASLDLRDADLNLGDDSAASREIIRIQGTGFNNTGALRNTSGTGTISFLTLDGNATVNTGGFFNASALQIATFDSNLNNGNTISTGAFTRNQPVIAGGGFDLTVVGGRNASDNFVLFDPSFSSALNRLIIREGGTRFVKETAVQTAFDGLKAADFTNGIEIGYGGPTVGDLTGVTAGTGAIVGARLSLLNMTNIHNTVNITMNGVLAAANNGFNSITVDFSAIPDSSTFLDGTLTLTGAANRNLLISDSIGNYTVVEQGNLTVAPVAKMVIGGVIQGAGGFTKMGSSEVRLTGINTFSGDLNVLRFGTSSTPWETHTYRLNGVDYTTNGLSEGWAEYSLTLNGLNGAMTDVGNINLQRRGMITLDNTTRLDATSNVTGGNNNNRIANAAVLNFQNGWLRINGGTTDNTEVLGTVNVLAGTNLVDLYPTDGAGTEMTLTITDLNRSPGQGIIRFQNLDATSRFSTVGGSESVRVAVTNLNIAQIGGGGAANTSTRSIVQGVFGGIIPLGLDVDLRVLGFNNGNASDLWNQQRNLQSLASSHFMTYEGGFLRPLDNDEYFDPVDGILSPTIGANQNVNLDDVFTIAKQNTTINSLRFGALTDHDGSGGALYSGYSALTSLVDHHAVNLMVDGTLTISSGMISSGYFALGNASIATVIMGGNLDFAGQEAIINNQNAAYLTTSGTISTGSLEIRSNIVNANGLHKTGLAQVNLDGNNSYTGVTTVSEGVLFLRNGRTALGVGGTGNGVVITGSGNLSSGNGITVGSATAREDIYVGVLSGDNQVMRVDNDLTVWHSNLTVDNVDVSGQTLFTPRVRTDNSATSIIYGNIGGGSTAISNDITQIDSRRLSFNSAGNNVFIIRGQIGDKLDGSGNAVSIADPISTLATLAGTRTNENEALRVNLGGGSIETNFILDRQYNAAGRLEVEQGLLLVNYDPTAVGNDGTGFWTNTAMSKIPNSDSTTTTASVNGGITHQGFILTQGVGGTANNNGAAGVLLTRDGQVFNMASWTMAGTGAKYIGGINDSGTVTYGTGTSASTLTFAGATAQLYAMEGGTVVFNQRLTGNIGTAPSSFGFVKNGRGIVELRNTASTTAGDANFVIAGGTLLLNHTAATSVALVGNLNARFDGGTIISIASSSIATVENFATDNNASRVLNYSVGGTEIVARTLNARNMTINMGNANTNSSASNFTRGSGATGNLVEDNAAGGIAQITLNFNASSTAAAKDAVIAWLTYGTQARRATDFAMIASASANDVASFGTIRNVAHVNNNVATWTASGNISEAGGAGFSGTLAAPLSISTLRFDANSDSVVDLGGNVLTVAGTGLATSTGAILVSSNVGSANKTITGTTGAALTTTGGAGELVIHHYGSGNLNINVPLTGTMALTIAGPSTTSASTIGTTGAVVLNGANTYNGQTFINGAVLSFNDANQLGVNPGAATPARIIMNGGTLRYTGVGFMSLGNRGITFNGNGGTIDVADGGGELYLDDTISSAALFRGDLIKVGAGTLTLNGIVGAFGTAGSATAAGNPLFQGLMDIRQGTLRLAGNHGDNTAGNGTSEFNQILGTSSSYADGTIMRQGTNLAIQMGNANDAGDYTITEWITFEGNNYVSVGTINTQTANVSATPGFADPNNERPINLSGVNTINGAVTFDVVSGQNLRLNNGGVGYTTGSGDIIKDGQGTMTLHANNHDFMGNLIVRQGRLQGVGQADVFGRGNLVGKTVTLGDISRQGIAEFALTGDNIQNQILEINHNINVVYNPAQLKRLTFETFANGNLINMNGNITLNDNLQVYINDAAETGGSQNYVNFNGQLKDGVTTSGNLLLTGDDGGGGANDNTNGRPYNYLVLKGDNSLWTGDVRVNTNTVYDQDQNAILRLEHANALTAANDVDMGFNSILQVGGGARTIGSLSTNGGAGPFIGNEGTMGASTNGSTEIIENAATTVGTLTVTQSTPVAVEVLWDAHFRNGTINSQFFAPGTSPVASAALNVVKAGNGWATMTLDNAYTGTTVVTGGTLQVGRGGVGDTGAANAAGLTSNVGTTVAGTGVIQGTTNVINGQLRPGDEAGSTMGTLTVNGNLTLGSSSVTTLQIQRSSYTAVNAVHFNDVEYTGWVSNVTTDVTYSHLLDDPVTTAQHDQLRINGTMTFAAGSTIKLVNNGYTAMHGDVFNLMDWTALGGGNLDVGGIAWNGGLIRTGAETGLQLELFELGAGYYWDVSQFNTHGILIVVVPEPGRACLLVLGLAALCLRRRRPRRVDKVLGDI